MSHYAVLVIGGCPELQLERFDENIEVEPYYVDDVSEAQKQRMLDFYKDKGHEYNTFESCYRVHGDDWNGNRWRLEDGVWKEYSTYNPDSKWDWYQLGGRYSGVFIKLKDGASGTMGDRSLMTMSRHGVDQAYKKDIDFDAIKSSARSEALETYRKCANKCGGNIPLLELSWATIMDSSEYAALNIEQKRELYHSQDAVKIWKDKVNDGMPFGYSIEDFQCTEEEYATRAELNSFIPYAVIYDGEWISRGDMGWWGITINERYAEGDWQKKVWELIDSVDDDTLFSFYDLHI